MSDTKTPDTKKVYVLTGQTIDYEPNQWFVTASFDLERLKVRMEQAQTRANQIFHPMNFSDENPEHPAAVRRNEKEYRAYLNSLTIEQRYSPRFVHCLEVRDAVLIEKTVQNEFDENMYPNGDGVTYSIVSVPWME